MLNTVCVSDKTVCPVSLLLLSSVDRLSGLAHVLAGSQERDVRPRGKRGMCCEVEYVCRKSWSLVKAKLLLGVVAPYFLFLGVCLSCPGPSFYLPHALVRNRSRISLGFGVRLVSNPAELCASNLPSLSLIWCNFEIANSAELEKP